MQVHNVRNVFDVSGQIYYVMVYGYSCNYTVLYALQFVEGQTSQCPPCFQCHYVSGSQYLVPESLSVQGDDDHGRVGEEALVVE